MEDIAGKKKVHRLPIVVSQESGAQLLGVPKLKSETGEAMAETVFKTVTNWKIEKDIVAMCFDTTSSGRLNGAFH